MGVNKQKLRIVLHSLTIASITVKNLQKKVKIVLKKKKARTKKNGRKGGREEKRPFFSMAALKKLGDF